MLVDDIYRTILRPILFQTDAEWMHDRAIAAAETASRIAPVLWLCQALFAREYPSLAVEVAGVRFPHPVGLAAGFDKNGRAIPFWAALGFSHVEIGSVSADPSLGNPKPRLFRIPLDEGIVVNYGLPNDGAERVARRLAGVRIPVPLGINIVNTNRGPAAGCEPDHAIVDDYLRSIRTLQQHGDYLVLNLSCPNTPEGRSFVSDTGRLRRLLEAVEGAGVTKPLFLKVAPFADSRSLDAFLNVVDQTRFVSGFAVNLPPGKPPGLRTPAQRLAAMPGAVAGKPAEAAVNRTLAELYARMDRKRYVLMAAGGVFTAEDAYRKIRLGASLVQLLTGMVYRGPGVVREICEGLDRLVARDGLRSLQEVTGAEAKPALR